MNEELKFAINKRLQIINNPYIFSSHSPNNQQNPSHYSQLIEQSPNSSEGQNQISEENNSQEKDFYVKCLQNLGLLCLPFAIMTPCLFCQICPCKNQPILIQQSYGISLLKSWGQFKQILQPGLHFINPISEQTIYLSYQTMLCTYEQIAITKDNAQITFQIIIFYRIIDAFKLEFKLGRQKIEICLQDISMSILRNLIGQYNLQQIIQNRAIISQLLTQRLNKSIEIYGLNCESSSIKQLLIPENILREIETVPIAIRKLQATIIENKANVSCSQLIKEISYIINSKAALQIRYLKMVEHIIAEGSQTTIILNISLSNNQQTSSSLI